MGLAVLHVLVLNVAIAYKYSGTELGLELRGEGRRAKIFCLRILEIGISMLEKAR